MAQLFDTGIFSVEDTDGSVAVGWKLTFYQTGTSTKQDTYPTEADADAGTNPNSNPVISDAAGRFPAIWLKTTGNAYKVVLSTDADVVKVPRDPAVDNTARDLEVLSGSAGSGSVGFIQAGTGAVATTVQAKARERFSILDFGAVSGTDVVDEIALALTALGTTNNATLIFPKGTWTIGANVDWSAYRNVTFILEPGCTFANSTNTIVFPERVRINQGVSFTGSGAVTVKNKDQLLLNTPPAQYVVASNEAMGVGALKSVTTGYNNFAWGYNALNSLTAGRSNIAIGTDALKSLTGGTAVSAAGTFMSNGDGNIAIGDKVLAALTTGYENVGVGMYNMLSLTTGRWNTCLGVQNLELATTAEANVVIGPYTLVTFNGNNSVAIGFGVGENASSGSNTAVGYVAMGSATTANLNTAVGSEALTRITTGTQNVGIGHQAAQNLTTGTNNVAVGTNALNAGQAGITNCTALGNNALLAVTTGNSNTGLGSGANNSITTETNCTAVGFNAQCIASNQVTLGDANVTSLRCAVTTITAISDARFKKDIAPLDIPDEALDEIEIVTFRWTAEGMTDALQVGVIAQQLDAWQEKWGLQWMGLVDKTDPDRWEATPGKLLFPMILRTQRLARRVAALEAA